MKVTPPNYETSTCIKTLGELATLADYSLMDTLNPDPQAKSKMVLTMSLGKSLQDIMSP